MTLAWGGVKNGLIPHNRLVEVDGHLWQADAGQAWLRFQAACYKATRTRLTVTEAYRSLATQQAYYRNPPQVNGHPVRVAYPGTSNHGWGRAGDIAGYGGTLSLSWRWMRANAYKYGFSWATGKASGERWHWEYIGPITASAPSPKPIAQEEDDDMKPQILHRTEGTPEWTLAHPDLPNGYIITTNAAEGLAWERLYGRGYGSASQLNRTDYIAAQAAAKRVAGVWAK